MDSSSSSDDQVSLLPLRTKVILPRALEMAVRLYRPGFFSFGCGRQTSVATAVEPNLKECLVLQATHAVCSEYLRYFGDIVEAHVLSAVLEREIGIASLARLAENMDVFNRQFVDEEEDSAVDPEEEEEQLDASEEEPECSPELDAFETEPESHKSKKDGSEGTESLKSEEEEEWSEEEMKSPESEDQDSSSEEEMEQHPESEEEDSSLEGSEDGTPLRIGWANYVSFLVTTAKIFDVLSTKRERRQQKQLTREADEEDLGTDDHQAFDTIVRSTVDVFEEKKILDALDTACGWQGMVQFDRERITSLKKFDDWFHSQLPD